MSTERRSPLRQRAPLLIALGVGLLVWKGGFGVFATEREVTWRLAVPYADIRKVELQVWRDDALLRREERQYAAGVSEELRQSIVMRRGEHQAIALVWLGSASQPKVFRKQFDPAAADALVLEPSP